MTSRVALAACVALLITAEWNIQSLAQAPAPNRGRRPPSSVLADVATPCVGRENSIECVIYRLDQIDRRLNGIDASLKDLQSRPSRAVPSGPPISALKDPGGKADANSEYIQQRIDAIAKVVTELVDRVNKL